MAKKDTIEQILTKDDLTNRLAEIAEAAPENVILAWYDETTLETHTTWFGRWPTAIGMAAILKKNIEDA